MVALLRVNVSQWLHSHSLLLIIKVSVVTTLSAQVTDSKNVDKIYSPKQVVLALISAMDVNKGSLIRSLFANDATQNYEHWYAIQKRAEKFKAWLESDTIESAWTSS